MGENRGLLPLLIAKAGCCLLLPLALTGALGSVFAWALGDGLPWLVGGAVLLAAGLLLLTRGTTAGGPSARPANGPVAPAPEGDPLSELRKPEEVT